MTTPLILAFDTSAAHCTAALLAGDELLALRYEEMAKGQAERIMLLLQDVLDDARATYDDLTALGVGIGPGNFTGIRISVAAARGLRLAKGLPTVGISALEALAFGTEGKVLSCLDAKRERLFVQGFGLENDVPPQQAALSDLPDLVGNTRALHCIGSGAGVAASTLSATDTPSRYPLAEAIARLTAQRYATTVDRPAPLYLRAPDAAPARNAPPTLLP